MIIHIFSIPIRTETGLMATHTSYRARAAVLCVCVVYIYIHIHIYPGLGKCFRIKKVPKQFLFLFENLYH